MRERPVHPRRIRASTGFACLEQRRKLMPTSSKLSWIAVLVGFFAPSRLGILSNTWRASLALYVLGKIPGRRRGLSESYNGRILVGGITVEKFQRFCLEWGAFGNVKPKDLEIKFGCRCPCPFGDGFCTG
eukprot:Gb_15395 [translate_table: standard]